jgi:hypothetical protein
MQSPIPVEAQAYGDTPKITSPTYDYSVRHRRARVEGLSYVKLFTIASK